MHRSNFDTVIKLLSLVKKMIPWLILAIIMGVLGFLSAIGITVFGGFAALDVLGLSNYVTIKMAIIIIIILAVLRGSLRYAEQASNHYIAFKLLAIIRDKIFGKLRELAPAKLDGKNKGNLISIITTDIELLEVFYAHTITPVAIAFLVSLIMTVFLCYINPIIGLIALLGYVTVGVIIPIYVSKNAKSIGAEYRDKFGKLSSFTLDNLRGLNEVLQYGCGQDRLDKMSEKTEELSSIQEKLKYYEGISVALSGAVIMLFTLAVLVTSVFLFNNNVIGFDGVVISVLTIISSFGPVVALSNLSNNLLHTFASGNRILDLLEEEPIVRETVGKNDINYTNAKFENVDFSYENEKIIDNLSLQIPQKGIIGISGKSGSGKSTLLKLLMRFYDIDNGKITISNKDIESINTVSLRNNQSYLTQETVLFNDTIEENIRISKLNATHEEIVDACKKASIHDFIESLPHGYKTNIGELGDKLSGGEKQRLGLARMFLHNSPLALLDEPTSNLDSLNEAIILKSIYEQRKNKCFILVSHRPLSLSIADNIFDFQTKRKS